MPAPGKVSSRLSFARQRTFWPGAQPRGRQRGRIWREANGPGTPVRVPSRRSNSANAGNHTGRLGRGYGSGRGVARPLLLGLMIPSSARGPNRHVGP